MITAKHMGKMGDIIYSLPTIRALGIEVLYLPESMLDNCNGLYSGMKDFLLTQGLKEVREYPSGLYYGDTVPDIKVDYDLDDARKQPWKGLIFVVKRYADQFGVKDIDYKKPWLYGEVKNKVYTLINFTNRHLDNDRPEHCRVDWQKINESIEGEKVFTGTKEEHKYFVDRYGFIEHVKTENVIQLAQLVKWASAVYCNQSLALTLAQGYGVPYWCQFKKGKSNCKMRTLDEHEL